MIPDEEIRKMADAWHATHKVSFLPGFAVAPDESLNKAGILPYVPAARKEDIRFCVMRPRGDRPELGTPPLQLCKGTRMVKKGEEWIDIKSLFSFSKDIEPLAITALREGVEELGLDVNGVTALYDTGTVSFTSAKKGYVKKMRLFAAHAESEAILYDTHADTTAERRWLTINEFAIHGRKDHFTIIESLLPLLQR